MPDSPDQKKMIARRVFGEPQHIRTRRFWQSLLLFAFVLMVSGFLNYAVAQVAEDTTQTEREAPELPPTGTHNNFLRVPYQNSFNEADLNRYSLHGVDGRYTFHRRLRYSTVEDFMMGEEERYQTHDAEWINGINMRLAAILRETFKEQNSFLQKLARIAPFLGFGFFEEYEVPIVPRQEYFNPEPEIPEN